MIRLRPGTAFLLSISAVVLRAEPVPIMVAPDGSGQFNTIQAAIDAVPDNNREWRVIAIKPGTYRERILLRHSKTFVILRGVEKDSRRTLITFNRYAGMNDPDAPGKKVGTLGSESVLIEADNFIAENLTFENPSGASGPAVAMRTMGDRQIFRNCRFLGWQDTLWIDSKRMYFTDCYFEGRIDVVIGRATAVFEKCHIHGTDGGCLTATSTEPNRPFGFVFLRSQVTCAEDRTYLGNPWQRGAATAFLECDLGKHVRPEGWVQGRGNDYHEAARFFEYKNTGPGADVRRRVAWSRQLTDVEAKNYTVENILNGEDRWDPRSEGR